jgi:hypothetical protein
MLAFKLERPKQARSYAPAFIFLFAYLALTLSRPGASFAAINETKALSWILLILVIERIAVDAYGQRVVVFTGLVISFVLVGVIAYALATNRYGFAYYSKNRPLGAFDTMQIPHGIASFGVMLTPFVLIFLTVRKLRFFCWPLFAALVIGVFLSFVRSSWLGMGVVLAAYAILAIRRHRKATVLATMGIGIALLLIANEVWTELNVRIAHGAGRVSYWMAGIDGTLASVSRTVYGGGAGASYQFNWLRNGDRLWSHNDFVEFFVTGGIVLVLIYVALIVWFIATTLNVARSPRQSQIVRDVGWIGLATCVAYIAISFFNGITYEPASYALAMLLGLLRGMSHTPGATAIDMWSAMPSFEARRATAGCTISDALTASRGS